VETTWTRSRWVEWWYLRYDEILCRDIVKRKDELEVTSKSFSHALTLENVFNDSLSSHAHIAFGLHVSNFPNGIAGTVVLTGESKFSVVANDGVAILD
jgi:hypothetical protein